MTLFRILGRPMHGVVLCALAVTSMAACVLSEGEIQTPAPDEATNEPNDSPAQAVSIVPGTTLSGVMGPEDVDWYLLEVPADYEDYKVTIHVYDEGGDCFTGCDPNLSVYADDATSLLYWAEDSVEDYCPSIGFVPTPGARYYLEVGTDYELEGRYFIEAARGGLGTLTGVVTLAESGEADDERGGSDGDEEDRTGVGLEAAGPGGDVLALPEDAFFTHRLIVGMEDGKGVDAVVSALQPLTRLHLRSAGPLALPAYFLIEVGTLEDAAPRSLLERLAARARMLPGVRYARVEGRFFPSVLPDDPGLGEQWAVDGEWGIRAADAWEIEKGSAETVVAVIDTGYDPDHPDLAGKAVPGYDFISIAESAGDGDARDGDPRDNLLLNHGSHVSGIIAAETDNGQGIAGIGWNLGFMPLRVCGDYGCTEADIIDAIAYAAGLETSAGPGLDEARAAVINLSLGGNDYCSVPLEDILHAARQRGVITVAAAGNDGEPADRHSPANCDGVIAVGATTESGDIAGFSNYGPVVDIMAPGVSIYSTVDEGGYDYLNGTSMAAPHVSALAGLIKSINSSMLFESVLDLISSQGRSMNCYGIPDGCGGGLLDAQATLQAALDQPDDDEPMLIIAVARDVDDPEHVFHAVVRDNRYYFDRIDPGRYRLEAGSDRDGDYELDEPGDVYGESGQTFTFTWKGEDLTADALTIE